MLASSFQDCVLLDVALGVAPALEVVFLDTQYHFPETLEYMDRVRRRYDMDLRIVRPRVGSGRAVAVRPRRLLCRAQGRAPRPGPRRPRRRG